MGILQNVYSDRLCPLGFNVAPWLHAQSWTWGLVGSLHSSLEDASGYRWGVTCWIGPSVCIRHCLFTSIQQCSHSFQEIPSFGRDTICKFSVNVSELKKMAAWEFENLLQVSSDTCCRPIDSTLVHSALYQSLTDSSRSLTMTSWWICSSLWHTGMA